MLITDETQLAEAPVESRPIDSPHDIAKKRTFRATKSTFEIEQRKPNIPIQGNPSNTVI